MKKCQQLNRGNARCVVPMSGGRLKTRLSSRPALFARSKASRTAFGRSGSEIATCRFNVLTGALFLKAAVGSFICFFDFMASGFSVVHFFPCDRCKCCQTSSFCIWGEHLIWREGCRGWISGSCRAPADGHLKPPGEPVGRPLRRTDEASAWRRGGKH